MIAIAVGAVGLLVHTHRRADDAPRASDIGTVTPAPAPSGSATSDPAAPPGDDPTIGGGLLGTRSTRLGAQGSGALAPTAVSIPRLQVHARTTATGLAADDRSLDLPPSAGAVVWWAYGATPGAAAGTVLLAGHVSWDGRVGVLSGLGRLRVGDQITVQRQDGRRVRYDVTGRRRVPKMSLAQLGLFAQGGAPRLVLVTCGGAFDRARHSYEDNVVVQASPA